jgi:hypothetical protein
LVPAGTSTVIDPQQGYPGGQAHATCGTTGGGGGAGGVGGDAHVVGKDARTDPCAGGDGGPGVQYDITGTPTWYAAGGGGGGYYYGFGGAAGTGGGGSGGVLYPFVPASPGRPNSGDGGGGTGRFPAGAGGSGVVIIRY